MIRWFREWRVERRRERVLKEYHRQLIAQYKPASRQQTEDDWGEFLERMIPLAERGDIKAARRLWPEIIEERMRKNGRVH